MATRTKQAKAAELNLSPSEAQTLGRLMLVIKELRAVDPDEMTARRIEILLAVALYPERSLIEHGIDTGMGSLAAYRHGSSWTDTNVYGKPGYGMMIAADRPFYEGGDAGADRRSQRRKHVALNSEGVRLIKKLLLTLKG